MNRRICRVAMFSAATAFSIAAQAQTRAEGVTIKGDVKIVISERGPMTMAGSYPSRARFQIGCSEEHVRSRTTKMDPRQSIVIGQIRPEAIPAGGIIGAGPRH